MGDMSMNTHLKNVKVTRKNASAPIGMDHLTVRGSSVRCILLPDSIPLDTHLIDDAPKKARAGGGKGKGRGFGNRGRGGARKARR